MAPKVVEKKVISFEPTWKDSDIKKNPKYATNNANADDDALDITKLTRRKGRPPKLEPQTLLPTQKGKAKAGAGPAGGRLTGLDDLDEEALKKRREQESDMSAHVANYMSNQLLAQQQKRTQTNLKSPARAGMSLSTIDSSALVGSNNNITMENTLNNVLLSKTPSEFSSRFGTAFSNKLPMRPVT